MSDPFGENNPFSAMFGDLGRLFSSQGPVNWDTASQLALNLAADGKPEPNVDPLERMKLDELCRVAELQVGAATGLATSLTAKPVTMLPVNRTQWVQRSLPAYKMLFERLATSLSGPDTADDPALAGDPMAQMLGPIMKMMSPMMLGMSAGSMVGHLAKRSFGQYDLPIPREPSDELLVLVPNLDEFAVEWSLPPDDLRLWICVHEITHHAVLGVPHIRAALVELLHQYLDLFEPNPAALEERLGELDMTNPEALAEMQAALADPTVMLGAIQSDAQRALLPRLEALLAVIIGYVDFTMDRIGGSLIPTYGQLTEALRRRRVEASQADRFVEQLFGFELSRAHYERAQAFIGGVVEREGSDALEQLWESAEKLPTPAEIEAPGLWLARIGLTD